ncbi:hypothetical protein diail_5114 [Diaporthe ilicicola]|nr:hypothetical protein diail_5114 [Diaporthe ilicicola]
MSAASTFKVTQTTVSSIQSIPSSSDAASTTFLAHACNCLGVWGAGIALELKELLPNAFEADRRSCRESPGRASLPGTCLLIPHEPPTALAPANPAAPKISIACLRTSLGFGRPQHRLNNPGLDNKDLVVEQTRSALRDFRAQLEQMGQEQQKEIMVWSPKFNSGAFKVPWERTERLIEEVFAGWAGKWCVMQSPSAAELKQ